MTAKEKILSALKKAPKGLCDTCLERTAAISPHQQVNATCRKLQGAKLLMRDESKNTSCQGCLKFNFINRLS